MPRESRTGGEGFVAAMTVTDATLLAVGSMIGSGIFIVSAGISRAVGSPAALLAAWALTGVITILGALAYAEMAAMYPRAGGQYVFLREAFGSFPAFLYGWTLLAVIQTGTIAAVAVAFGRFAGVILPAISPVPFAGLPRGEFCAAVLGCHTAAEAIVVGLTPQRLAAVGIVWLLTMANVRGVREGKAIQTSFTVIKAGAVIALVILAVTVGRNGVAVAANFSPGHFFAHPPAASPYLLIFGAAMVGCLFSTDAWNNVTFAAAEVRDPARNLPRALIVGAGFVTLLYVCTNVAYLSVLPLAGVPDGATAAARGIQYATQDRVATAAAEQIFGARGSVVMACAILVSTFGCVNGLILSGARVYYAMARDGLMFEAAAGQRAAGAGDRAGAAGRLDLRAVSVRDLRASHPIRDLRGAGVLRRDDCRTVHSAAHAARHPEAVPRVGVSCAAALYIVLTTAIALTLVIVPGTRVQSLLGLLIVLCGAPVYAVWRAMDRGPRLAEAN